MRHNRNEEISVPDTSNAEYQVLADLIANPGYILEARGIIDGSAFSTQETRNTWETLNAMQEKGDTIDIATVGVRIPRTWFLPHSRSIIETGYKAKGFLEKANKSKQKQKKAKKAIAFQG